MNKDNNNNKYKRIQAIDIDTNEVMGTTYLRKDEEVILDSKKKLSDKQKAILNSKDLFKSFAKKNGGFIQLLYRQQEILNTMNISKANITRIIFLATYIDYNNSQQNLLCIRKNKKLVPMTKKDMKDILKLSNTTFNSFLSNVKKNGLLFEVNNKFYIEPNFVTKGENKKILKDSGNGCFARLFIDRIRSLYNSTEVTKHKILANVFMLIPFIHMETNIITLNRDCVYNNMVNPMSLKEIGDLLNIKDNKGNLKKLVRELESLTFITSEGKKCRIVTYVKMNNCDYLYINPIVIYRGSNYEQMCEIAKTYFFMDNPQ